MNNDTDELYLVGDVSRELGRCDRTVRSLDRTGKLPAMRTPDGTRIWRRSDVLRFKSTYAPQQRGDEHDRVA